MENSKSNLTALSASRLKTFENCSWLYWSVYHLKLPQAKNDGARKGDVCHRIFELLINKKHHKHYKTIVKGGTITASPAVEKLTRLYFKDVGLNPTDTEVFLQVDQMILVGLKNDFFVKGGTLVAPEFKFDITNDNPPYYIRGFMDKPFIVGNRVIIDDYKSSKRKFEGEDQESNVQALMYSLAASKLWPDKTSEVRFIFLQYPEDPLMRVKFSLAALKGFEFYLATMQEKVNKFSSYFAYKHFAADQPTPEGEFKGKLMCGFAKQPGQKKKDGNPMWCCPYKFGFRYYSVKKDGVVVRSAFKLEDIKVQAGEAIEAMEYKGCPKFNSRSLDGVGETPIQKTYPNVLDDF